MVKPLDAIPEVYPFGSVRRTAGPFIGIPPAGGADVIRRMRQYSIGDQPLPDQGRFSRSRAPTYPWLDSQDDDLEAFLMANWQGGIQVNRSWMTSVAVNKNEDEVRRGLVEKPTLSFTVPFTPLKPGDFSHLEALFNKASSKRFRVPFYTDFCVITQAVVPGSTSITVSDTSYLRLAKAGLEVAVCRREGTRWLYEVSKLRSDSAKNTLFLSAPIAGSFAPGCRVFPLVSCEMMLDNELLPITDSHGQAGVAFKEIIGASGSPSTSNSAVPDGFQSYAGLPILTSIPHDWNGVSIKMNRTGSSTALGRGIVLEDIGPIARHKIGLSFTCLSRQACWKLIQFFDSVQGRLKPFWVVSPINDMRGFAFDGTYITVPKDDMPRNAYAGHSYLSYVRRDGVVQIERIVQVVEDGNVVRFLTANPPSALRTQDLRRISWGYLARLDSDEMVERWTTDKIMSTSLVCSEIKANEAGTELNPTSPDFAVPGVGLGNLDSWVPDTDCFETSGIILPMFQTPCLSCDPNRPAMAGANLELPKRITVTFKSGQFSGTPTVEQSTLSTYVNVAPTRPNPNYQPGNPDPLRQEFLPPGPYPNTKAFYAMLRSWVLTFDEAYGATIGNSRHPHHIRLESSGALGFPSSAGVQVVKRRWTSTLTVRDEDNYRDVTITVVLQSETPVNGDEGCHGTVFHIYLFANAFQGYTDGGLVRGIDYYVDDPVVWRASEPSFITYHPNLWISACIPTTMEAPCGSDWNLPHETDVPIAGGNGMPFAYLGQRDAVLKSQTLFKKEGQMSWAAMTIGASCDITRLFEYVCIHPSLSQLPTTPANPGYRESNARGHNVARYLNSDPASLQGLTYTSSASIGVCPIVSIPSDCCPSISCWQADSATYPGGMDCCFSTTQPLSLELTQFCLQTIRTFDATTALDSTQVRVTPYTTTFTMMPRTCSYSSGSTFFEWYAVLSGGTQMVVRLDSTGWQVLNGDTLAAEIPSAAWPSNTNACSDSSNGPCIDPFDPDYRVSVECAIDSTWEPLATTSEVNSSATGFSCGSDGSNPIADPASPLEVADQVFIKVTVPACGSASAIPCCSGFTVWNRSTYTVPVVVSP